MEANERQGAHWDGDKLSPQPKGALEIERERQTQALRAELLAAHEQRLHGLCRDEIATLTKARDAALAELREARAVMFAGEASRRIFLSKPSVLKGGA